MIIFTVIGIIAVALFVIALLVLLLCMFLSASAEANCRRKANLRAKYINDMQGK